MLHENQIPEPETHMVELTYYEKCLVQKILRTYQYLMENPESELKITEEARQAKDIERIVKRMGI